MYKEITMNLTIHLDIFVILLLTFAFFGYIIGVHIGTIMRKENAQ